MRPDLGGLVSISALIMVLLLLLPKRDWRSFPARLRATVCGERRYVFGPPSGRGALSSDFTERWFQLVRRELPRAIALGIPLHALVVWVEMRGAKLRQALDEEGTKTRAGLLCEHLSGEMTEAELHDRLREGGLPTPAGKIQWTPARKLTMPPMRWRLEWERHLESLRTQGQSVPGPNRTRSELLVGAPAIPGLEIRTLGEIRISANREDFAPRLLHRPALAFAWLYLLARESRKAGDRITRSALADELFPGLDPDQQRRKLRQRLNEMSGELSGPLAGRIKAEGEYVSLDLSGCDYDVRKLIELAEQARVTDDLLAAPVLGEVEKALGVAGEEWLPGWEEIERRATDSRSGAGSVITHVRDRIAAAHLTLLEALADACLTGQQPERAIPHLEEAVGRRPERVGLARKLADAYERSGQTRRAAQLREEYGLDEAS
jgi:DNA-binding SARP family transcriptional activator